MDLKQKHPTVDDYLLMFPENIKVKLEQIRKAVKETLPEAEEIISYNMPAYKFHGILLYFAAHKNHIGFYPGSSIANDFFKDDLKGFQTSKGTIKFPIKNEIPVKLIKKIVEFKMNENLNKLKLKIEKKQKKNKD